MSDYKLRFTITADAKKAIESLDQVKDRVDKLGRSGAGDGGGFGSVGKGITAVFGGNVVTKVLDKTIGTLMAAGAAWFDYAQNMEQVRIAFTSLMGSADAAREHVEELLNLSKSTPLEFQTIARMSQRLQGAGIEAKKIVPLLKDIGNVAAATGPLTTERLEGIAVALSQIQSKTRLSAEEMEQMAERGVPAWQILAKAMGTTQDVVRELGRTAKLNADQMFSAFMKLSKERYSQALEAQLSTFGGASQQIINILYATYEKSFRPIYDRITAFAADLARALRAQQSEAKTEGERLGFAIGEAIGMGYQRWLGSPSGPSSFWDAFWAGITLKPWREMWKGFQSGLNKPIPELPQQPVEPEQPSMPTMNLTPEKKLPAFGSLKELVISTGNPQWDAWILQYARQFDLDPNLVLLQISAESNWKPNARSPAGARGVAQFMPGTAKRFGVDVNSVEGSIRGLTEYMAQLRSQFGTVELALAAYNAGEGRVQKYGGIPPFRETQNYVAGIKKRYMQEVAPKAAGEGTAPSYGTYNPAEVERENLKVLEVGLERELELRRKASEQELSLIDHYVASGLTLEEHAAEERIAIQLRMIDEEIQNIEARKRLREGDLQGIAELDQQETLLHKDKEKLEIELATATVRTKNRLREEEEKRAKEAAEAEEKRAKETAERMHQMWEEWVEQSEREHQEMLDRLGWEMEWRRQRFGAKTFDPLFQAVGGKWDEAGRPVISFTNLIQNLGDVAGNVLMQIGQGLGSMLESWVMLGDQADVSMRKMVASVLAGVAAQAATLSLFHFAMGLVALTPWGAIEYGSPTYHFTAAAIWAAIAGGTALAGRAIAGDSAKSAAGSKKDGTRQSDRNMTPPPISRVSPDAYNSSRRDPAIADLAESVAKLSDKLSSMRPADVIVAAGREKPGLIGRIAIENVKENASLGTELLRRAGVR